MDLVQSFKNLPLWGQITIGGATILSSLLLIGEMRNNHLIQQSAENSKQETGPEWVRRKMKPYRMDPKMKQDAEYIFQKKVNVFADDEDEAYDELGYIHEKEYNIIDVNDGEYVFQKKVSVFADDEDEAYDELGYIHEKEYDILEVKDAESFEAQEMIQADDDGDVLEIKLVSPKKGELRWTPEENEFCDFIISYEGRRRECLIASDGLYNNLVGKSLVCDRKNHTISGKTKESGFPVTVTFGNIPTFNRICSMIEDKFNAESFEAPVFSPSDDDDDDKDFNPYDEYNCHVCDRPYEFSKIARSLSQHYLKESDGGEKDWYHSKSNPDGVRRTARNIAGYELYYYGMQALEHYMAESKPSKLRDTVIELLRKATVPNVIVGDVVQFIETLEIDGVDDLEPRFSKDFSEGMAAESQKKN